MHRGKNDLVVGVLEQDANGAQRCFAIADDINAADLQRAAVHRDKAADHPRKGRFA